MKPGLMGRGYLKVSLYDSSGKFKQFLVHRLILLVFAGPCPDGMQACHKDGNRINNSISNLRWDTVEANHADKIIHGTTNRGERHGNSRFTKDDIVKMRREFSDGSPVKELSARYKASVSVVCGIVYRRSWTHVS